ncbi:MAG: TlpA disulfide reductase family protein [Rhodospirillaceae bacterium]|nr:TlpA disulfide reductase family protein [Rhodospirillaceae bacterium]
MKRNGTTDRIVGILAAGLLALLVAAPPPAADAAPGPKRAAEAPSEPPAFSGTSRPFVFLKEPLAVQIGPFADAEGGSVTLERYKGKVLLVNFWATWCAPCVHEMPTLDRLQAALGGPGFAVLTVSLDRKGMAAVGPFWEEQGYRHLPILLDSRWKTARRLGVSGLPATFLLDRKGRIVGYLIGPAEWDSPQAKAFLRFYIARPGS